MIKLYVKYEIFNVKIIQCSKAICSTLHYDFSTINAQNYSFGRVISIGIT